MKKEYFLLLTFIITVAVQAQIKSTYNIGLLLDNTTSEVNSILNELEDEITAVVGEDALVKFPETSRLVNYFDSNIALNHYDKLANDPAVDIIIAFGIVNNKVITKITNYVKPTILFGALSKELIDKEVFSLKKKNLTPIWSSLSYTNDIKLLKKLSNPSKIGVIIEKTFTDNLPILNVFKVIESELNVDIKLIAFNDVLDITSNLEGIDAVYFAGGFYLNDTEIKKLVSDIKNVNINQVVFGNGTDEILDLIVRVFCNPNKDKIITLPPTYGMYDVIAKTNGVENIEIPLKSDFSIDSERILGLKTSNIKILFLCSPNNPTGNSFEINVLDNLIKKFNGIVVIDEAYIDFSSQKSLINHIDKYENLIITQTMSKAYGMAGIRLGMGFSNQKIINYLNKIKPPYNINVLTERKALEELNKIDEIKKNIDFVLNQRKLLVSSLEKLDFVEKVYKSDANFLLVKVDNADLRYNQLSEKGIIVRNRSNQPLCQNCLRITIGTKIENNSLIKTLNEL